MSALTWDEFAWPDWVPAEVRNQIEQFWGASSGRSPAEWEENARSPYNNAVPLGTRGAFWVMGGSGIVLGRYVHAWNNVGRVVLDDGTFEYVSGVATVDRARERAAHIQKEIDAALKRVEHLAHEQRNLLAFAEAP